MKTPPVKIIDIQAYKVEPINHLLFKIYKENLIELTAWISNVMCYFMWDVIIYARETPI